MKTFSHRLLLAVLFAVVSRAEDVMPELAPIAPGPFKPTLDSLKQYEVPEWFMDAKLGIFMHWGPCSVGGTHGWYGREMYRQGSESYKFHVANFGHPSKFGYKDVCRLFKAEHFDDAQADALARLYKKAGARYLVPVAVHHDNFDMWDSKFQPRWNAKITTGKDIIGMWKRAADANGLRFGVASHVARTYRWFQTAHQADKDGPLKGVPYDGTDPQYRDLYGVPCQVADTNYAAWNVDCDYEQLRDVAPPEWERQFERRMRDLLDRYEPDLYYVDGGIPFHVHLLWVTLAGNASLAGAESGFRHSEPAESRKNTPESVQRSNALVRLDQASATGNGVKLTVAGATTAKALRNPVWTTSDNIRDPSVLKVGDGYYLCYSRFTGTNWGSPSNWTIGSVFTKDFRQYDESREISPKGYASPGDVVYWHGRYLLPYQSYPAKPTLLCVSESLDLHQWTSPKTFLAEAADLPWNTYRRVIDPSFVVEGGLLHCYFVGSADVTNAAGRKLRANLLGHAITRDPRLERWEVLTPKVPLLGVSDRAPDGVENVMVFRTGDHWTMIFSEGLADQHLALAVSNDLRTWKLQGPLEIPRQKWMARKYGAPFVWRDGDAWRMILMGENAAGKTTFGLLSSPDGKQWTLLPEP